MTHDDEPAPPAVDRVWGTLGEGEELLFEGHARGRPSLRTTLPLWVLLLLSPFLIGALVLLAGRWGASPGATWTFGWTEVLLTDTVGRTTSHSGSPGPLWAPASVDVGPISVPVPWVVLVALFALAIETLRVVGWRSLAVAITNRRVLTVRGVVRRVRRAYDRTGQERLEGEAILGLDEVVVLRGLDEGERPTVMAALARFEEGPVPAPPAPLLNRRRLVVLLVVLALGLAFGWRQASGAGRVRATFTRGGLPGAELFTVDIDSPSRGGLRVVPWSTRYPGQVDGRPFQVDPDASPILVEPLGGVGSSGGGFQMLPGAPVGRRLGGLPLTLSGVDLDGGAWRPAKDSASAQLTYRSGLFRTSLRLELTEIGATYDVDRLRLAGTLHAVDGTALPFEVELSSPGKVTLDLSPP
jgi:hypothetical protein